KMPSNLSFEQAAAMPLVGVSALQALSEHINLKAGQNIFIHGGAGGIGTIAIQIAKHIDAYVATTATGDGIDYVKKLGADQVIDFKSEDFTKKLQDFDAVFDTTPGDDFTKSLDILKPGGVAVSMLVAADEAKAKAKNLKTITQSTTVTTAKLDKLRELIEDGVITPHIDKIFPLDNIQAAFEARESGLAKGKVVIKIR